MPRYVLSVLLMAIVVVVPAHAASFVGEVTGVIEGDVVTIDQGGTPATVRLFGIDCPELAQPYGAAAKEETAKLALNKDVLVNLKEDRDEEGRLMGFVTLPDGTTLNETLVTLGYAWAYDKQMISARLKGLQVEAMKAHKGLWADPSPLAPWDYREKMRKEVTETKKEETSRYTNVPEPGTITDPNVDVRVSEGDVLELKIKGNEEAPPPAAPSTLTPAQPQRRSALGEYRPEVMRSQRRSSNVNIIRTDKNATRDLPPRGSDR